MVVPAGGAWLAVHVLLLLMLVATQPLLVTMAVTSSSRAGLVSDYNNVTAHDDLDSAVVGQQQADRPRHRPQQQQQQQPNLQPVYREGMPARGEENSMLADGSETDTFQKEDIQVGCRELRAKRYISDGFCTSTKPIKEVVCAGNCLPIMDLPWYAEFIKVWSPPKLQEWQCEEDVVRRKSVHLLCRNGQYRTYRIKVVKSCRCKNVANKDNRTHPRRGGGGGRGEGGGGGGKKKKKRRRRKKGGGKKRGGRKNRKNNNNNNNDDGKGQSRRRNKSTEKDGDEDGRGGVKGSEAEEEKKKEKQTNVMVAGAVRGRSQATDAGIEEEEEVVEVDLSQIDQRQDETSRQQGGGGGGGGRKGKGGRGRGRKRGDRKRKARKPTTNSGGVVSEGAGQGGVGSESSALHKNSNTDQDSLSPSTR